MKDTIFNALDKSDISDEEAYIFWKKSPQDIQLDALKYGMSDTPTREKIYMWLQENYP